MTTPEYPTHPLLGRRVNHDPRSRAYRLSPAAPVLRAVRHEGYIGILDQQIGCCTGCAGVNTVYRSPYFAQTSQPWYYPASLDGAVELYSAATGIDPWPGQWPPDDTGSDGLSIAKVLKTHGVISGYLHAFTVGDALAALMKTPLMTGLPWYNSMFDTDAAGHVKVDPKSGLAGGHELCVDEYVPAAGASPAMVGGPNSWSQGWGDRGRWYLTVEEWGTLLAQQGDVTALVPVMQPAPQPNPTYVADDADRTLWSAAGGWARRDAICGRSHRRELMAWARSKGLA